MRASPERFARCRSAWRWPPDFRRLRRPEPLPELRMDHGAPWARTSAPAPRAPAGRAAAGLPPRPAAAAPEAPEPEAECRTRRTRSEERRVGKEGRTRGGAEK